MTAGFDACDVKICQNQELCTQYSSGHMCTFINTFNSLHEGMRHVFTQVLSPHWTRISQLNFSLVWFKEVFFKLANVGTFSLCMQKYGHGHLLYPFVNLVGAGVFNATYVLYA